MNIRLRVLSLSLLIVTQFLGFELFLQAKELDQSCCTEGDIAITQSIRRQLDCCCDDLQNGLDNILEKLPCSTITPIRQADLPRTISTAGKYCIVEDLTFSDGNAITIAADNVLLDFDIHSLTLTGEGAIGIDSGAFSNLYIKDPVINITGLNVARGISALNSKNLLIQRPIIQNTNVANQTIAISLNGTHEVVINQPQIANCNNAVNVSGQNTVIKEGNITSLTATLQGPTAIAIANSKNVSILNTNVNYSNGNCIGISSSANVFMDACIIIAFNTTPTVSNGVRLDFSSNCLFANSIISGANGANGFVLFSSPNNSIENCEISNYSRGIQLSSDFTLIVEATIRNCFIGLQNNSTSTLLRNSNIFANTFQNITGNVPLQITPTDNVIF